MAQTVTIQRGQSTCQAQVIGYPTFSQGGSITMVTAPSSGVSRVILNQLTINQTSPNPFPAGGGQQVPNSALNAMVYLANNYNGDGSTRALSPVGYSITGSSIARVAFPAGTLGNSKVGVNTQSAFGQPMWTASAGSDPSQITYLTPTVWGNPGQDAPDQNQSTAIVPTNIYIGPNDQLILKVASGFVGGGATTPTYTVSWSFTLITET